MRSANAVVSDSNASQTTRNGILYSPSLVACRSASLRTADVFMVEFHAMLAMNRSSVSIGYGSPRQALVMTLCIRPCADSGCSQEKPLSMRTGSPCSSTKRSSGPSGQPSGAPSSGVFGLTACGPLGGRALRRHRPRVRRAVAEAARAGRWCPAATSGSRARVWSGSRWSARRGRASRGTPPGCRSPCRASCPTSRSRRSAARSCWSRAVTPSSWARRRIVARRDAGDARRPFGRAAARPARASSWNAGATGVPSAQGERRRAAPGRHPSAWSATARWP